MPFALVIIGLVMIVTGAKDTHCAFGKQMTEDFTGKNNFTFWIASIGAVGALGYFQSMRDFSRMFMALILIGMILAQQRAASGGFFAQFSAALKSGPVPPARCGETGDTASAPGTDNLARGDAIGGADAVASGFMDLGRTITSILPGVGSVAGSSQQQSDARQNFSWIVKTFGRFFIPGGSTVPASTPMF